MGGEFPSSVWDPATSHLYYIKDHIFRNRMLFLLLNILELKMLFFWIMVRVQRDATEFKCITFYFYFSRTFWQSYSPLNGMKLIYRHIKVCFLLKLARILLMVRVQHKIIRLYYWQWVKKIECAFSVVLCISNIAQQSCKCLWLHIVSLFILLPVWLSALAFL